MTEEINNNTDNRNVKIQNINIAVFSSDDYIRNSFDKENSRNFTEIYNWIVNSFLEKKLGETNNLNSKEIKSKIIFLIDIAVAFIKLIIRIYRYSINILNKFRKIIKFFNFKRIFSKKY